MILTLLKNPKIQILLLIILIGAGSFLFGRFSAQRTYSSKLLEESLRIEQSTTKKVTESLSQKFEQEKTQIKIEEARRFSELQETKDKTQTTIVEVEKPDGTKTKRTVIKKDVDERKDTKEDTIKIVEKIVEKRVVVSTASHTEGTSTIQTKEVIKKQSEIIEKTKSQYFAQLSAKQMIEKDWIMDNLDYQVTLGMRVFGPGFLTGGYEIKSKSLSLGVQVEF